MSSLTGPAPLKTSPLRKIARDIRYERRATVPYPPGETRFSMTRTRRFAEDPLPVLLEAYEKHGPVFTVRILHGNSVFLLGPEANHHVLVSNAANFSYREGYYSDLFPLLGDGLLTIDREFHRRSRRIMLPAFHRQQIAASIATIDEEVDRALVPWRDGQKIDLYEWTRELALRIAMRALFGLRNETAPQAAVDFEQALGFYAADYLLQALRGPRTPWARMKAARARLDVLIYGEIRRRRASGERGTDILSLLLDAEDEAGASLSEAHIRDEVMTLLFAGHDTTTSTISFLFYELSHNPEHAAAPMGQLIDETLRMYPPAWIAPRRALGEFEVCGQRVPAGAAVNYCSWASHHLPDVWPDAWRFDPARFTPAAKEALQKGAYVPFGGGSRTCIGMRFAQAEVDVIGRRILERWRLDLDPGYVLAIRQMPTISPKHGMPMTVRAA
ncbi:Pentalenene oxygenase [Paraconexibacter sp. AEG42_29]|uniref:Pentalenene oxygenase n=1 Tax=Paraconexibacter sp. AEG42_29 TaxID=2997339 RepID=A0AAU7APH5_9ACTN